jgi:hypothetical protein
VGCFGRLRAQAPRGWSSARISLPTPQQIESFCALGAARVASHDHKVLRLRVSLNVMRTAVTFYNVAIYAVANVRVQGIHVNDAIPLNFPSFFIPSVFNLDPLDMILTVPDVGVSVGISHSSYFPAVGPYVIKSPNHLITFNPTRTKIADTTPATKLLANPGQQKFRDATPFARRRVHRRTRN